MSYPALKNSAAVLRAMKPAGDSRYEVTFLVVRPDGSVEGPFTAFVREQAVAYEVLSAYRAYGPAAVYDMPVALDAVLDRAYIVTALRATDETRSFIREKLGHLPSPAGFRRGKLVWMGRAPLMVPGLQYRVKIERDGKVETYDLGKDDVDIALREAYEASLGVLPSGPKLETLQPEVEFFPLSEGRIASLRLVPKGTPLKDVPQPLELPETPFPIRPLPQGAVKLRLLEVVDGDTVRVDDPASGEGFQVSIRLLGVDAPEAGREGAFAAKDLLASVLSASEYVYFLEDSANSPDRYNRRVGELYVKFGTDYINVNLLMTSRGFGDFNAVTQGVPWRSAIADQSEYRKWAELYRSKLAPRAGRPTPGVLVEPVLPLEAPIDDRDEVLGRLPEHGLRIGDCQFVVPPTRIRVTRRARVARLPLMRSKSSIKKNSGHSDVVIEVELYFNSPEEINGRPYRDRKLGRVYYVNGLRPLIAQFKRTPFLPVQNELLNEVHGIYAVTLVSLQVSTVPGFPGSLRASLIMMEFDHTAYMPDADSLAERIMWPLFRYYYQGALRQREEMPPVLPPSSRTTLWSIPDSGFNDDFLFLVPDRDSVTKIATAQATLSSIEYMEAGHEPSSPFQKRYHDAKLMKEALQQRERWEASRDKSARTFKDMFAKGLTGFMPEALYEKAKFFPSYDPNRSVFDEWYINMAYTSREIEFLCDLFILKLLSEENRRLDGVVRLYTRDGEPTDYFAFPANRVDIVQRIHFDPDAFKEKLKREAEDVERELVFLEEPIEDLVLTSLGVSYNNTVTSLQLQGHNCPVHQYLGSQDTYLHLTFETTSREALRRLRELHDYSQSLARTYRVGIESGFLRFKNHLAQLFGVDAVVIESIDASTVEDNPGLFRVEVVLSSFDRTQRDHERLEFLFGGDEDLMKLETRGDSLHHQQFKRIERRMKKLETYPDLELPTYDEVSEVLRKLGYRRSFRHSDPEVVYVDPDFYVVYSTTFKRQVHELVSGRLPMELRDPGGALRLSDALRELAPDKEMSIQAERTFSGEGRFETLVDQTPVISGPAGRAREFGKELGWKRGRAVVLPYRVFAGPGGAGGLVLTSSGKLYKSYHTARCSTLPMGTVVWIPALSHLPNSGFFVVEDGENGGAQPHDGVHTIEVFYSEHQGDWLPEPRLGWFERLGRWLRDIAGENGSTKFVLVDGKSLEVPVVEFAVVGRVEFEAGSGHSECRSYLRGLFGWDELPPREAYDPLAPQPEGLSVTGMLSDMFEHDCRGRLVRAFPTYQLYFVDEGRWISWWRLFDNFYGLNAVSSIDIYGSRKSAAATCVVELSNVYGNLTSVDFSDESADPPPLWKVLITPRDERFQELLRERQAGVRSLFLRPGARIHLRMGYGSNAAGLPIVFNGTITEMAAGDVVRIVAQGDGLELTAPVKARGIQSFEPRNKMAELLLGEKNPFQELLFGATRGLFASNAPYGVVHFGLPDFSAPGPLYRAGELVQNVYPANGLGKMTEVPEDIWQALQEAINLMGLKSSYDEVNLGLRMDGKSIWDVIQVCAGAVPDYIASVVPFEMRSTLFYGRPYWPMAYRYDERGIALKKPYWQLHIFHSLTDILSNDIVATEEGVYTNVYLRFNLKGRQEARGEHVQVFADTDILPEKQKTMMVASDLELGVPLLSAIPGVRSVVHQFAAYPAATHYAQSILVDSLKDMYKGTLLVLGEPSIKPHDPVYIFDTYTQMTGLVLVKEYVHHFSQQTGFVTSVVPDCCVAAVDGGVSKLWGALSAIGSAAGAAATVAYFTRPSVQASLERAFVARAGRFLQKDQLRRLLSLLRTDAGGAIAYLKKLLPRSGLLKEISEQSLRAARAFRGTIPHQLGRLLAAAASKAVVSSLVGVGFYVVLRAVEEYLKRWISSRQCVVISPLRVVGKEFSAGINGSKGAVIGSVPGPVDAFLEKAFGWAGVDYSYEEVPLYDMASMYEPRIEKDAARPVSGYYHPESYVIRCSEDEFVLMARMIQAEAEGEPYEGKLAVGAVIVNRVKDRRFPNTVRDVLFQDRPSVQFSPIVDGRFNRIKEPNEESLRAADEALRGRSPVDGALFFYNPERSRSDWIARNREVVRKIGNHVFAR